MFQIKIANRQTNSNHFQILVGLFQILPYQWRYHACLHLLFNTGVTKRYTDYVDCTVYDCVPHQTELLYSKIWVH